MHLATSQTHREKKNLRCMLTGFEENGNPPGHGPHPRLPTYNPEASRESEREIAHNRTPAHTETTTAANRDVDDS